MPEDLQPSAPSPPSVESQTILTDQSAADVRRLLRGLSATARAAASAGAVGSFRVRLAQLGPGPGLSADEVAQLDEEAFGLGLAGIEHGRLADAAAPPEPADAAAPAEPAEGAAGPARFLEAHDRLARTGSADLTLLLDADAHPSPGMLTALLGAMRTDVGVVGARLLPVAGPVAYDRRTGEVDEVGAACALVRRSLLSGLGGEALGSAGALSGPGENGRPGSSLGQRGRSAGSKIVLAPRAAVFVDRGVASWAGPDGPLDTGRHRLRADPEGSQVPAAFVAEAAAEAAQARAAATPLEALAARVGAVVPAAAGQAGPGRSGDAPAGDAPGLSVVVRTQGDRLPLLGDALACLAAQHSEDVEVLVVLHHEDESRLAPVIELVGRHDHAFAARVRVERVAGGGRSRPLNAGLDLATGAYVAFLDDDDVVAANWAEAFLEGARAHPGRVIRSRCATRRVRRLGPHAIADHEPVGEVELPYDATFDYVWHLRLNSSPICSIALPRATLEAFALRFDESLPVIEDWDLLMRVAQLTGVADTGEVTSIYHLWEGAGTSRALHEREVWHATWLELLARWDRDALLLPPGSVVGLVDGGAFPEMLAEYWRIRGDLERTRERLAAVEGAAWWKLTAPPRWMVTRLKTARRRSGGQG